MRVFVLLFLSLLVSIPAFAHEDGDALLNKVVFRLSSEQWVSTKTALVSIGVNASVNESGLEQIQDAVLKKVSQLASQGDWHILSFDRSVDQSGLEKVRILAQARLPASALTSLRDKTKAMSKPGETYSLDNVQFTPSEDELRAANVALRGNIYQQAKEELDRLNKVYPDQKYYVHNVDFVSMVEPEPVPIMPQNAFMQASVRVAGASPALAVGDKLILSATVIVASNPPMASEHPLIKNIT